MRASSCCSLHPRDLITWEPIGETWRCARVVSADTKSWGTSRTRRRSWRRRRWLAGGREDRRWLPTPHGRHPQRTPRTPHTGYPFVIISPQNIRLERCLTSPSKIQREFLILVRLRSCAKNVIVISAVISVVVTYVPRFSSSSVFCGGRTTIADSLSFIQRPAIRRSSRSKIVYRCWQQHRHPARRQFYGTFGHDGTTDRLPGNILYALRFYTASTRVWC